MPAAGLARPGQTMMKPSHFLGELKVLTKLAATPRSKGALELRGGLQYVAYCSAERSDAEFVQMHFGGEFVGQNNLGQWSRGNGDAFDRNLNLLCLALCTLPHPPRSGVCFSPA